MPSTQTSEGTQHAMEIQGEVIASPASCRRVQPAGRHQLNKRTPLPHPCHQETEAT